MVWKATVIKTCGTGKENRHVDEWNRNESPEINLYIYGQLITNKATKAIQWGKGRSFQQMVLRQPDIHTRKDELKNLPHTISKTYLKWIIDLNVWAKTIKFIEENVGVNFMSLS